MDNYKDIILKTFIDADILNARIYIQVLDNLVEWKKSANKFNDDITRSIILININFILYHTSFNKIEERESSDTTRNIYTINQLENEDFYFKKNTTFGINGSISLPSSFENYIKVIINKQKNNKDIKTEILNRKLVFIDKNHNLFKSDYFLNAQDVLKNIDNNLSKDIIGFIETGIL